MVHSIAFYLVPSAETTSVPPVLLDLLFRPSLPSQLLRSMFQLLRRLLTSLP